MTGTVRLISALLVDYTRFALPKRVGRFSAASARSSDVRRPPRNKGHKWHTTAAGVGGGLRQRSHKVLG
jgi:hypothetical protein